MTDNNNALEIQKEPENPASQTVVGIRFRSCGKIYTFDANDIEIVPGSRVVVDSELGLSIGHVVTPGQIKEKTKEPLKKVLRLANDKDLETIKNNRALEDEAKAFCMEKVKGLNLPMKIVATEMTMDKKRLTFYFTADGRIDFRELVRDLASKFKTRIEMRQIGVRDEVKLLGGFGCCGRQTCCSLFLTSFAPITIRMAKEQALSINQSKLSGVCGRLMCCLGYEHREASPEEDVTSSSDEALVTVAEETPENNLLTVDSVIISEEPGTEKPEYSSKADNIVEEKAKGIRAQPDQPQEKTSEGHKQFKRDRRWKKRHRTNKTHAEGAPAKLPLTTPAETPDQSGAKGKGRPFNRRRKFWKKKQD
ncbi:MAG: stage 0 sporulation protein [Nitrospirae bacterium]|nr:stage 0 sporulation protein [Nitrospirota bacterium]